MKTCALIVCRKTLTKALKHPNSVKMVVLVAFIALGITNVLAGNRLIQKKREIQSLSWANTASNESVIVYKNFWGWSGYTAYDLNQTGERNDSDDWLALVIFNEKEGFSASVKLVLDASGKPEVHSIKGDDFCGRRVVDVVTKYEFNLNNDPKEREGYSYNHVIVDLEKKNLIDVLYDDLAYEAGGPVSLKHLLRLEENKDLCNYVMV